MNKKNLSLAAVLASGIMWGTIGIFTRYFDNLGIHANNIVTLRLSMGTLLLFLFLALRDPKALKLKLKDLWIFVGSGILGIILFQTCYMITIQNSSLSLAAVLLYTSPVFVMLMSALFFREKVTPLKMLGAAVTVAGCALASGIVGSGGTVTAGVLITGLLSGIGYASYSIWARAALNRGYKPITMTAYSFLFALIPLLFVADYPTIYTGIRGAGWPALGMWFLLALITEALPYLLYTEGLAGMETGKAAVTVAIEPIVATLVGIFFFKESMTPITGLGTVLVIGAIILMNLPERKRK